MKDNIPTRDDELDLTTTISLHAIERFNERFIGVPFTGSPAKVKKMEAYMLRLLDEAYPIHNDLTGCDFIMKDIGLVFVKEAHRIVTVKNIRGVNEFDEYHDYKEDQKQTRISKMETKNYKAGKKIAYTKK